jgi:phosphoserine phosphatase
MYCVQEFTKPLGFDLAVGETYHEKDGFLTGDVDNVVHSKNRLLKTIISEHGLTTEESVAVGDTHNDIGMLELAEQPIAFNPEKRLFDYAKEQGWKIVIERKNTVITLERKNGEYILRKNT